VVWWWSGLRRVGRERGTLLVKLWWWAGRSSMQFRWSWGWGRSRCRSGVLIVGAGGFGVGEVETSNLALDFFNHFTALDVAGHYKVATLLLYVVYCILFINEIRVNKSSMSFTMFPEIAIWVT
jgi:hypothetical protein